MIKQNLQVVKPKARQVRGTESQPPFWVVYGSGHIRTGLTMDVAYKRWVEEYINRALYGPPRTP